MEYAEIDALREKHPAWKLLRAGNASLVLAFLGRWYVEDNHGATGVSELANALDDELYARNLDHGDGDRFPKRPEEYLEDWAAPDARWLRSFYPDHSDEVHYEATSAFEKAYAWVTGLAEREFVGTESRLHTVVELLRQIVHGTDGDPEARLERLREQRDALDREIADVESGQVAVLGDGAVRDRYQQFASTARELLSDFREVGEKFRELDRNARERIAGWEGSKGDLLAELVASRSDIGSSDQGTTFQAFYDFLLSERRQDELSDLLRRVQQLDAVTTDRRLGTIHHDWSLAAERTQGTVRKISEQFRRFLDDQVWVENRRVVDLVRQIEATALEIQDEPPADGLMIDLPGIPISLPMERPLYSVQPAAEVDSLLTPSAEEDLDMTALFGQHFVDRARLADNLRAVLPAASATSLNEIIDLYPIEYGAAEILGYLSLAEDDLDVEMDETDESIIDYVDIDGHARRARLPGVRVSRR
ncbi:DUF3375 domain-containing protein [Solicola gregarius]|uniref:DUF3375 domain-containing protein n=1 Tax=Solicola gregarius TaxID=2908642 RepID=A0AA46YLD0_9ACTN|nr:DUF3375 domain-containing protein [Solicola gregarius]UYM05474.1 DUF3375 domain-containing protein [Solicola gregarius]